MARGRLQFLLAAVLLAVLAAVAFAPALDNGFVEFDDGTYVVDNPRVSGGLTPAAVRWAFTAFHGANWHPLTWLSHQLDATLFGLNPRGHHATSVALHVLNALLLFRLLSAMTGRAGASFAASLLFAVHPLRVESVAWVAERKDVLSAMFFLLAVHAYLRHARGPTPRRLLAVIALFALGLLAKPMVVTLPLLLLLLDVWPLGRVRLARSPDSGAPTPTTGLSLSRAALEKMPLFVLAGISGAVTLVAQAGGGLKEELQSQPWLLIGNAVISLVRYPAAMVFPADLSPFYPLPDEPHGAVPVLACALLLGGITAAAVAAFRRSPWLLTGWAWYLIAVSPVIGLVQVGRQAMADRYLYLPGIGLVVAATWGLRSLAASRPRVRGALALAATAAVAVLVGLTRQQCGVWHDTGSLFRRAVAVDPANWFARENLARLDFARGRREEGLSHYREAVRLNHRNALLRSDFGMTLYRQGLVAEAMAETREALRLDPTRVAAHNNLGIMLVREGSLEAARRSFEEALRLKPDNPNTSVNLGAVALDQGRNDAALGHFREALRLRPAYPEALFNAGVALERLGRLPEAAAAFREASRLRPSDAAYRARVESTAGR